MTIRARVVPGTLCIAALLFTSAGAAAQTIDSWTTFQELQAQLKADRQAVVAHNLPLTETEAQKFWPVYKEYRGGIETLADRLGKLIMAYAKNYEQMDEAKVDSFFDEWQAIDRERAALRAKYVPRVREVLPAAKTARYFQIENKLDAVVNLALADEIPLVPLPK